MTQLWLNFKPLLEHEYAMAVYGVMLLHIYKWFIFVGLAQKKKLGWKAPFKFWLLEWDDIGKSLVWVGIMIVLDDEVLGWYNGWAEVDVTDVQPWMYFVGGFFIDSLRRAIATKAKFKDPEIDIDLYS